MIRKQFSSELRQDSLPSLELLSSVTLYYQVTDEDYSSCNNANTFKHAKMGIKIVFDRLESFQFISMADAATHSKKDKLRYKSCLFSIVQKLSSQP